MATKKEAKASAKEQILQLFEQARLNEKNAQKHIKNAIRIALKNRIRLSKELKKTFCANCNTLFHHGKNSLLRVRKNYITIHCKTCQQNTRIAT
ncbi:hypothetical protein J4219_00560 [Candidatus Woesearchaeota archaeon]|nr:hypothetical protein [Candidatus Woesearchaeota archaeon]